MIYVKVLPMSIVNTFRHEMLPQVSAAAESTTPGAAKWAGRLEASTTLVICGYAHPFGVA